jgi:hypothetical protein
VTNERHVLKLTVEESSAGCRVVAEFNSKEREIEVGMLPDDFRNNLASLQTAILQRPGARTAEPSLRPKNEPPVPADDARPNVRAAAGTLTAGSDEIMVREVGSRLFSFIFQRSVLELHNECYANYRKLGRVGSDRACQHPVFDDQYIA